MAHTPGLPAGFSRDFSGREASCLGVFGSEGTGKTRFAATAHEWAAARGMTPAWLVADRKTRATVRQVCSENGWDLPLINQEDFLSPKEAMAVASLDRETEHEKIAKIFQGVYAKFVKAAATLGEAKDVGPIIFETGSQLWDWISYAHFGRKQGVGKSRVWGPPKQDWSDLLDSLAHKPVIITLWGKDEYRGEERTGKTKPDGPPHIGYTTTSVVRLNADRMRKLKPDETYVDRFTLDVYESQEQKGLESVEDLLKGTDITYTRLMQMLRPED